MRVAILTLGLTVLALGVSGYPLPRTSDGGKIAMTSDSTLDQVPGLTRRKHLTPEPGPGSPGYGIGVFSVSQPIAAPPPIQRIKPIAPVTPSPQPVNPPAVVSPPPATPAPITNDPEPEPKPAPEFPPPIFDYHTPATEQIRTLNCLHWWNGDRAIYSRPPWCNRGPPF